MPYVLPTVGEFRARYPEFATASEPLTNLILADAGLWVDTTWLEGDYQPAIMAIAGHFMARALAASTGATGGGGGAGGVETYLRSVSFADRTVTYGVSSGASARSSESASALASSPYGEYFLWLLSRNSPHVLVI